MQYIQLTSVTITSGSPTVTVGDNQKVNTYTSGDLLFVDGQNPLIVSSTTESEITLDGVPDFSHSGAALLMASNIRLRDALSVIEENNRKWNLHFSPFINWISTSDLQADLYDTLGNAITVYSAQGLNQLAQDIGDATTQMANLEGRIDDANLELDTIEATLDSKVVAAQQAVTDAQQEVVNAQQEVVNAQDEVTNAQAEVQKAKDWATSDSEVETGLESSKTYAARSAASAVESQTAEGNAAAFANYKGYWSNLTGALNIPATVRHNDIIWQLDTDLADVTASEPSAVNNDWFAAATIGGNAANADRLGNELPEYYAKQSDMDDVVSATDTNAQSIQSNAEQIQTNKIFAMAGMVL